jgi:hypothetical protein
MYGFPEMARHVIGFLSENQNALLEVWFNTALKGLGGGVQNDDQSVVSPFGDLTSVDQIHPASLNRTWSTYAIHMHSEQTRLNY